jgi:tetratricopeptide (TPR) repeat protein
MPSLRVCAALLFLVSPVHAQTHDWSAFNRDGIAAFRKHEFDEAETLFKSAMKAARKLESGKGVALGDATANLAAVYQVTRRYPEAVDLYKNAVRLYEKNAPTGDPRLPDTLDKLGLLYGQIYRFDDSHKAYRRVAALYERTSGSELDLATVLEKMAGAAWNAGSYAQARADLGSAMPGDITQGPRQHGMLAIELAPVQEGSAAPPLIIPVAADVNRTPPGSNMPKANPRTEEVIRLFQRALTIREKALGTEHTLVAVSLHKLGWALAAAGDYPRSADALRRSLTIQEKAFGTESSQLETTLAEYVAVLARVGDASEYSRREQQLAKIRAHRP